MMNSEIYQAITEALSNASDDALFVAQDAATKWACIPGSVADKMRQVVQRILQAEVDARLGDDPLGDYHGRNE